MIKNMISAILLTILLIMFISGGENTPNENVEPYVNYIKEHQKEPVDYILQLFEDHDLVILCERSHREMTQYDFINRLIQDERFIKQVGNIYTEIGAVNHSEKFTDFVNSENLDEEEIREDLGELSLCTYANINWNGRPFFKFLRDVYDINQSLNNAEKIQIFPSNLPFEWDTLSNQNFKQALKYLSNRDSISAYNIIESFDSLNSKSNNPQKALVIMNYRHAFNNFTRKNGNKMDNVGRFLFDYYGDKVANVMINSLKLAPGEKRGTIKALPVQNGKWDAAFVALNNPACGFNFDDSPFGKDSFDYYPFKKTNLQYEDVFDGFIFYQPLHKHILEHGIPEFFDSEVQEEVKRRCEIRGYDKDKTESIIKSNKIITSNTYSKSKAFQVDNYKAKIDQWLE